MRVEAFIVASGGQGVDGGQEIEGASGALADRLFHAGLESVTEVQDVVAPSRIAATSRADSSRSWGSAPGGVRFVTTTDAPPICSAAYASG